MASVIWDESDPNLKLSFGGGTWSKATNPRFFDGAAIWPAFSATEMGNTGMYGWLSITFDGTQIRLFGNTPTAAASQFAFVSIDGSVATRASYGDIQPPAAVQWYQSPVLAEGRHTINVLGIAGTSLDYAVVAAGQRTPLVGLGQRLIVDDDDEALTYTGSWTSREGTYESSDSPYRGMPYGNATHESSTPGSKATFLFSGTNCTIYSISDYSHLGSVTVRYTISSLSRAPSSPIPAAAFSQTLTYAVTPTTPEYISGVLQRENSLLYSSPASLPMGQWNLTMEVLGNTNGKSVNIDYILYSPGFATLSGKPCLSAPPAAAAGGTSEVRAVTSSRTAATSTRTSTRTAVAAMETTSEVWAVMSTRTAVAAMETTSEVWAVMSTRTAATAMKTTSEVWAVTSTRTAATAMQTSGANGAGEKKNGAPVGAIVGGVLGGIALLAPLLLISLILFRRRIAVRRASGFEIYSGTSQTREKGLPRGPLAIKPFIATLPGPATSATPVFRKSSAHRFPFVPSVALHNHSRGSGSRSRTGSHVTALGSPETTKPMMQRTPLPPRISISHLTIDSALSSSLTLLQSGEYQNSIPPTSASAWTARMQQRVRELETAEAGGEWKRAAELRGRIVELTRQAGDAAMETERDVGVPPPYRDERGS